MANRQLGLNNNDADELLSECSRWLSQTHLKSSSILVSLRGARHFLVWLTRDGTDVAGIDGNAIRRFRDHECTCPPANPKGFHYSPGRGRPGPTMRAVGYFVRFLRQTGRIGQIEEFRRGQEVLKGFVNACREHGYSATSLKRNRYVANHFIGWLHTCQIAVDTVTDDLAERFIAHDCVCVLPSGTRTYSHAGEDYVLTTRKIINYILARELIPEMYRHPTKQSGHELQDFREWMRRHRGVKARTESERVRIVLTLLPDLGEDPEQYDASLIRNILLKHFANYSRQLRKKHRNVHAAVPSFSREHQSLPAGTGKCGSQGTRMATEQFAAVHLRRRGQPCHRVL